MARGITATPPTFPPRLNPDLLFKDIPFEKRHVGPPVTVHPELKLRARLSKNGSHASVLRAITIHLEPRHGSFRV